MTDTIPQRTRRAGGLGPRDAAGARGHAALPVRRDLRGAVTSPRATSTPAPSRPRSASRARPGFIYSRYANPTVAMFEERMRLLEGARGRARHRHRHGGGHRLAAVLPQGRRPRRRGARAVRLVPLRGARTCVRASASPRRWSTAATLEAWQRAVRPNTKAFFFETPANPTLDLVDIAAVSRDRPRGRRAGRGRQRVRHARCCRSRCKLGADVVVYSATKHIDGQGRCLGGVVLGSQAFVKDHLHNFLQAHRARRSAPSTPG